MKSGLDGSRVLELTEQLKNEKLASLRRFTHNSLKSTPVARLRSIRIISALSAELDLDMFKLDVLMAHVNGDLNEKIFMGQADGFL